MKQFNRKTIRRILKPAWFYFIRKSLKPISHRYGMNRGIPIDRYYINKFLLENKKYIKGACLEIRDGRYGQAYQDQIEKSDILDIDPQNKNATIHGDLRELKVADNTYDCILLTQVLQYIDDIESCIKECHRILKTNGTLFITVPIMSRLDPKSLEYYRFTPNGLELILQSIFKKEKIRVRVFGNILVGRGFWVGQAAEEFSVKELDHFDPMFPILAAALTVK